MALPSLSAAVSRVAATMNHMWTPPWSGISRILFGPETPSSSSSRSRRSGRRHRRSRSCPRIPSAIRSSIPPPHSYVFRSRDSDTSLATGQAPYPPLFFQSAPYDRTFAYSILDREAGSPGRQNGRCSQNDDREKNFLSALLSILVIATLATALTQPKWFSVRGGVCGRRFIGLQLFIELGTQGNVHPVLRNEMLPQPLSVFGFDSASYPDSLVPDSENNTQTHSQADLKTDQRLTESQRKSQKRQSGAPKTRSERLESQKGETHKSSTPKKRQSTVASHLTKSCAFSDILPLQRAIVLFSLMAIIANLVQFFLDTLGSSQKWLDVVRVHALGSILGVIFTILIVGVSYMIATLIEVNEKNLMSESSKERADASHVEVRFELSYYLITLSGLIGLVATACNLLRKPTLFFLSPIDGSARNPLIDFYPRSGHMSEDPLSPIWSGPLPATSVSPMPSLLTLPPPPPPYSP